MIIRKTLAFITFATFGFIICVIFGFYLYNYFFGHPVRQIDNEILVQNSIGQKLTIDRNRLVSPVAKILIKEHYLLCGHTKEELTLPPNIYNGKPISELMKIGDNANIEKYEDDEVDVSIDINSKCSDHFLAKIISGKIVVAHQNNPAEIVETLNTNVNNLPPDDLKKLTEGMEINGTQELARFLEDFNS